MCDVCVCATVCLGTDYGIHHFHREQPWERYEMYRKRYSNCTYVDGNLEVLFLDGQNDYNMSFLEVSTIQTVSDGYFSKSRQ